jgi:uncharacterized integral membrane protein
MPSDESKKNGVDFRKIALGVLVLLALIIIFQNMQVVTIQLLFWKIEMSRILLLFLCLLIGLVVGLLAYPLIFNKRPETQ